MYCYPRLEAVTSRLEDITTTVSYPDLGPALQALEIVPTNLDERHVPLSLQAPDPPIRHLSHQPVLPYIEAFDTFMNTSLHSYVALSHALGDKISAQANMLQATFATQRTLLVDAATQPKPTPTDLETLLRPMKDLAAQVDDIAEENRHDQHYEHLSCVANSVGMFGWVVKEMKGWLVVDEAKEAVAFWGNRVIVKHKRK